jgi:hypothetical protein
MFLSRPVSWQTKSKPSSSTERDQNLSRRQLHVARFIGRSVVANRAAGGEIFAARAWESTGLFRSSNCLTIENDRMRSGVRMKQIIDAIGSVISAVILWLLLGTVLSVFIGPGALVMSAFIISIFSMPSGDSSSCSCECERERVYSEPERGEGLRLPHRQRVERREPIAALPAFAPPRRDEFDASYRDAQTAAWSRALQHHVPSISLTAEPASPTTHRRTARRG